MTSVAKSNGDSAHDQMIEATRPSEPSVHAVNNLSSNSVSSSEGARKRPFANGHGDENGGQETLQSKKRSKPIVNPSLMDHAKERLSKWAARLFDPDRPRGLVEPPKTIPLNDEFLKAFGKRVKEFDESIGRVDNIDQAILSDDEEALENDGGNGVTDSQKAKSKNSTTGRKLKLTNLPFRLDEETLESFCRNRIGPIDELKLVMDKGDATKNSGLAYVVFEQAKDAETFIAKQLTLLLQGRQIRATFADAPSEGRSDNNSSANQGSRYWQASDMLSIKCFRCGKPGHMEADCPNPPKVKLCPLCANTPPGDPEPHDLRNCPLSRICFNCGTPGHVSRDCPAQRGLPPRVFCSICCSSDGHDKWQCHMNPNAIRQIQTLAKCMKCHKVGDGYLCCETLQWGKTCDKSKNDLLSNKNTLYCWNCGSVGHTGLQCNRPSGEDLARNDSIIAYEWERADEYRYNDERESEKFERENRRRRKQQQDRERSRARSAPPSSFRQRGSNNGNPQYYNNNSDHQREQQNQQEYRYSVGSGSNDNRGRRRRGYY